MGKQGGIAVAWRLNPESGPEGTGKTLGIQVAGDGQQDARFIELAIEGVNEGCDLGNLTGSGGLQHIGRDEDALLSGEGLQEVQVGDGIFEGTIGHGQKVREGNPKVGGKSHT
jgi:hypothetical protein